MNTPVVPELTDLFHPFRARACAGPVYRFRAREGKARNLCRHSHLSAHISSGCTAALINDNYAPWIFAVCFVTLSAMIITAYFFSGRQDRSAGITTAVAAYLCFLFGALVWWQLTALAAALAVVTVLLLATQKAAGGAVAKN